MTVSARVAIKNLDEPKQETKSPTAKAMAIKPLLTHLFRIKAQPLILSHRKGISNILYSVCEKVFNVF